MGDSRGEIHTMTWVSRYVSTSISGIDHACIDKNAHDPSALITPPGPENPASIYCTHGGGGWNEVECQNNADVHGLIKLC